MKRRQTLWLGVHCFQSTETRRKQASNYETVFSRDFPQTISSAFLTRLLFRKGVACENSRLSSLPARVAVTPLRPGAKKDGCFRRLGIYGVASEKGLQGDRSLRLVKSK